MISRHDDDHSSETQLPASTTVSEGSTTELPCFVDLSIEIEPSSPAEDGESIKAPEEFFLKPLSDVVLEQQSHLVVSGDDHPGEVDTPGLELLRPLLGRPEPLTWVFAGVRLTGDDSFSDGRLTGEWFAEEWRTESGRATDLVLDATWPGCNLATLKSHLRTRVVRHRPDVAVLFFDHSDAAAGIKELPQFERRLMAVLSVLSEIGAAVVLVQPPVDPATAEIDRAVYSEALSGIAKERGVAHLMLPEGSARPGSLRTPNSKARNTALFVCREALRMRPIVDEAVSESRNPVGEM